MLIYITDKKLSFVESSTHFVQYLYFPKIQENFVTVHLFLVYVTPTRFPPKNFTSLVFYSISISVGGATHTYTLPMHPLRKRDLNHWFITGRCPFLGERNMICTHCFDTVIIDHLPTALYCILPSKLSILTFKKSRRQDQKRIKSEQNRTFFYTAWKYILVSLVFSTNWNEYSSKKSFFFFHFDFGLKGH